MCAKLCVCDRCTRSAFIRSIKTFVSSIACSGGTCSVSETPLPVNESHMWWKNEWLTYSVDLVTMQKRVYAMLPNSSDANNSSISPLSAWMSTSTVSKALIPTIYSYGGTVDATPATNAARSTCSSSVDATNAMSGGVQSAGGKRQRVSKVQAGPMVEVALTENTKKPPPSASPQPINGGGVLKRKTSTSSSSSSCLPSYHCSWLPFPSCYYCPFPSWL